MTKTSVTVKAARIMAAATILAALISLLVLLNQKTVNQTVTGGSTAITESGKGSVHITNTQNTNDNIKKSSKNAQKN